MPSSRDLSSPTDVHSQDDASDRGIVFMCFIFVFFSIWRQLAFYALPLCCSVSNAMFSIRRLYYLIICLFAFYFYTVFFNVAF